MPTWTCIKVCVQYVSWQFEQVSQRILLCSTCQSEHVQYQILSEEDVSKWELVKTFHTLFHVSIYKRFTTFCNARHVKILTLPIAQTGTSMGPLQWPSVQVGLLGPMTYCTTSASTGPTCRAGPLYSTIVW